MSYKKAPSISSIERRLRKKEQDDRTWKPAYFTNRANYINVSTDMDQLRMAFMAEQGKTKKEIKEWKEETRSQRTMPTNTISQKEWKTLIEGNFENPIDEPMPGKGIYAQMIENLKDDNL